MISYRHHAGAIAVAALTAFGAVATAGAETEPEAAAEAKTLVVATGLNGPRSIHFNEAGSPFVAEADIGQITRLNFTTHEKFPVVTGLNGPSAVDIDGDRLMIVTSAAEPPDEASSTRAASLLAAPLPKGDARFLKDLEQYELQNNPDGQLLFDPVTGAPLDVISNPFYLATRPGGGVLIADGGGNDVLLYDTAGRLSTFFVPPTVNTGACRGRPNNDPAHPGCDSVPTGIDFGPDGSIYVSALTGEAPGEGRVYKLNQNGRLLRTYSGFNGPTGVAVGPDGAIYVSELFHGAPAGPPPPGFDPRNIGRIVRVGPSGARSAAQVTMPLGLEFRENRLYSTAWSVAIFLGIPDAGQVVRVMPQAFEPLPT